MNEMIDGFPVWLYVGILLSQIAAFGLGYSSCLLMVLRRSRDRKEGDKADG
jgi:hypothetical protein